MSELEDRIARLSPEKRAVLTFRLKHKQVQNTENQTIIRRERAHHNPLSFAQQRLWFLDRFEPDSSYYNIPAAVRLTGPLDAEALKRSLNEIVRRHEVLRTTFEVVDGEPVQFVAPALQLDLPVTDVSHLSDREARMRTLALEEGNRPFDLARGPLLRGRLLRLDARDHVLLLTLHHIVYDGWSTAVFVRELSELYHAFSRGLPSPLPDLPVQYADYAIWQQETLHGERLERQLAYWRAALAGAPPVLDLPTDHPRPPVMTYRGAHHRFEIPPDVVAALKALSRSEGATPFMTLLAVFQALLHRYTGATDISVGIPTANRTRAELEPLIGCFINTLVIRTDLSETPTFRELLARVRRRTLDAQDHQDLPFEMLVEALQLRRDMSTTPLFQVFFDMQPPPLRALRLGDLELSLLEVESGVAKFDLALTLIDAGTAMTGEFGYSTDLFEPETIRRMTGHFLTLLRACAEAPDRDVASLPILSAAEHEHLVREWNATALPYPQNVCFHRFFEAQAARTPEAPAVVIEADALDYRTLNRRANQVARVLRKLGAGPEQIVGLAVERSPDLLVGLLGILKAGSAYLPLDPTYPHERLAFMLADSGARLLLTQERFLSQLPPLTMPVVCLDRDRDRIDAEVDANLTTPVSPDNLAYVIYTSGSTGRPKGAMIQHRSMLHLATALYEAIYEGRLEGPLRLSLNAPVSFDASVQQIVMLAYGHALHIIPQEVRHDGAALVDYVRRHRLHVLDCVPTQLKLLLDAGLLDGTGWVPRAVLPGGEAIDTPTWRQLQAAPATEFYNMYGPTECTVDSTIGRVRTAPDRPTIGRPVANARAYVLDAHLHPVPVGVAGELYLGGAGVGRGYLHRPGLTAERFVPDPFSEEPGARLYRTGDLVRALPDGNLAFLGRTDHQVKVRGFRIELGEIEAALRAHAAVHESAVLVREDVPGDVRLVAYTVPDGGDPERGLEVEDLRAFLRHRLPDYMVPAAFVTLDALPLTPNGKVDRRALPAPDTVRPDLTTAYVPPQTPLERELARVWQEVLRVERIGRHDDFFALGGDSIRAAIVSNALRQALHADVSVKALFLAPTLAELAAHLQAADPRVGEQPAPTPGRPEPGEISPVPRDGDLRPSSAQQRLWFLEQLEPGSPFYTIAGALRMHGDLDVAALERALNEIVRRHEVLRTAFATVDGKPRLTIAPDLRLTLSPLDLTDLPAPEQEARVQALVTEAARLPFDLAAAPLLRVRLLRLAPTEHVVLLTMHHMIADGWSMGVLYRELSALYAAFSRGLPSPLPPLPVHYVDYAHWQRDRLRGAAFEAQLAYWQAQLQGAPDLLALPLDHPRPAVQTANGTVHRFTIPAALTQALRDLGQNEACTLFMTLMAAFQTLLYRYAGQEDVCVGTPVANRTRADLEALIGFFANTLVIRTDLSGAPSFRELLRRVRETTVEAYAHADVPFDLVVDAVQPERNLSYAPLFQVMFAFQGTSAAETSPDALALPGLTLTPLDVDTGTAKFDLSLSVTEKAGALAASLEYNTDLFESETIARMGDHFRELLRSLVAHPDRPVAHLSLLTEAERHRILVEWNATVVPAPPVCAHRAFEAQAARTPDAPALLFEDQTLTYGELDRRANQLAHALRALGVGPDRRVGICVERSPVWIVAILGVLKAGGAYVPLDPDYPQERLSFMIEDAQLAGLLAQTALLDHLPPVSVPVICLDAERDRLARLPGEAPATDVTADNLAYVIYTSGSTGTPKGVLIEHHSLCNTARNYIAGFGVGPGTRVLQFFSFSFDGSVADIFTALLSGATLCLVPPGVLPGPDLNDLLRRYAVSFAVLTPSALAALPYEPHPSLRVLLTGGEACTPDLVRRWAPGRRFINAYGPTEAAVAASWYEVRDPEAEGPAIPIGRPMSNVRLYIVDRAAGAALQPVPVGVAGELVIGGAGVARGYLNRPDLTGERFLPDPFVDTSGARVYRTGDLARYRPDGTIEFLGRLDDQVKVRGFRIEVGEIEARLREHPALQDAVVLAREDSPGVKRLVAYAVPGAPPEPTTSELRAFLAERLPDYMVPAIFTLLPSLPLTPAGKVDRRALPAPEQSRPDLGHPYVAPRSEAEEILARIWTQVLGVERVGVHDNFFELGGDSILSIQVVARASQAGLHLTPRQVFQTPTVAGLAAAAVPAPGGHPPAAQADAEQGPVVGAVPLTPIQAWFFEQDFADPHHWNQAFLLEVREPLDGPAFETALAAVLAHHDALRMRFTRTAEGWQQTNAAPDRLGRGPATTEGVPFERVDLAALSGEAQTAALHAAIARAQAGLDLAQGPLVRGMALDLGRGRPGRLLIVVHHLVIDGVSWRILVEDLLLGYRQALQGQEVRLPPKTTSFRTWAQRLSAYARSEEVAHEIPYWASVVAQAGEARTPLPLDTSGGENREAAAQQVTVRLGREETRHLLHDVHGAYGTNVNDVLLTALVETLPALTGRRALLVDLEGHGREDLFTGVDVSRTVGWFTTLTPVALDARGSRDLGEALKTIKEQLRAVPRKGVGYGLLRYLNPARFGETQAHDLEAEISFNYLGQFDQVLAETGLFGLAPESVEPSRSPRSHRPHVLDVVAAVVDGGLQVTWTYATTLHHRETVARLADIYVETLRRLIAHCLSPDAVGYTPSDFPDAALSEDELDALILEIEDRA